MGVINLSAGDSKSSGIPIMYSLECRDGDWYIIITGVTDARITQIGIQDNGISAEYLITGEVITKPLSGIGNIELCWVINGVRNCDTVELGPSCPCLTDYSIVFTCRNDELWCDFSTSSRCGMEYELVISEVVLINKKGSVLPPLLVSKGILCNPISRSFTISDKRYMGKQVNVLINVYSRDPGKLGGRLIECSRYFPEVYTMPVCAIGNEGLQDL